MFCVERPEDADEENADPLTAVAKKCYEKRMDGVEKVFPIETPFFRRAAQFWYELENEKNQLSDLITAPDPRAQAEAVIQEACRLAEVYVCSPAALTRPTRSALALGDTRDPLVILREKAEYIFA
jgi:hypothetical protein